MNKKEHPLHIRLALLGAAMEVVGSDLPYEIEQIEKEAKNRWPPPYIDFEPPMPKLFKKEENWNNKSTMIKFNYKDIIMRNNGS